VDRMGAADGFRRGLRKTKITDLPGLHQLGHGAHRFLDRRVRVDPVLVVEVDVVDPEALERLVAGLPHIFRIASNAEIFAVLAADVREFGGKHDLVAAVGYRLADQDFVGEGAVHVGGVKECDAKLERAVDGRDRLGLIATAIEFRHAHAAEAQG
jgi:hypothetical protein